MSDVCGRAPVPLLLLQQQPARRADAPEALVRGRVRVLVRVQPGGPITQPKSWRIHWLKDTCALAALGVHRRLVRSAAGALRAYQCQGDRAGAAARAAAPARSPWHW